MLDSKVMSVDVLLATYNGARYLSQQIDSLLAQNYQNFVIFIRDDNSSDNTRKIVDEYLIRFPNKIRLITDSEGPGGAKMNFGILLRHSTSKYVMCCDQDDVWLPDKIDHFLKMIQFYESVYDVTTPILLHGDLKVVDNSLDIIHESFWDYQNIDVSWGQSFSRLLSQNSVTGCSCIVNRALLDVALPIPTTAVMHDWWLALVACSFGKIISDPECYTLYRQHEANVVGARKYNSDPPLLLLKKLFERKSIEKNMILGAAQAKEFGSRYKTSPNSTIAKKYASLSKTSYIRRRLTVIHYGFWKMGLLRNISWLIRM